MDVVQINQRIREIEAEQEANVLHREIATLENELYEMDIEAMQHDVKTGRKTEHQAENEIMRRSKQYFG